MKAVDVALINAFVFLIASNFALMLTCTTLYVMQQLRIDDEDSAVTSGGLLTILSSSLLVGFIVSLAASASAIWCTSRTHASPCSSGSQGCLLPYLHLCAHVTQHSKVFSAHIAAAISGAMKLASSAFITLFTAGRIIWHSRWKGATKPPSQKLSRAIEDLHELIRQRMRIVECDSNFCLAGLFGWLSPTCAISSELVKALTDDELKAIIRHEITHKRRRDHILRLLLRFLSFAFPFPWFLWLRRNFEEIIERTADELSDRSFRSAIRKLNALLQKQCAANKGALKQLNRRSSHISVKEAAYWRKLRWSEAIAIGMALIALTIMLTRPIFGTVHCFLEVVQCGTR